ncbi:MAG: Mrp/NBP35 family ATP-binding protein [Bacteroidales bacterium]|nr:Mrp/NBP35 family ATP-binding protein [Bacteroidales bacterium]
MSYSKQQIVDALKEVIYFPKSDNIISLEMVDDIQIKGQEISFTLLFPEPNDKSAAIVEQACVDAIEKTLGSEAMVKGNITLKAKTQDSLEKIKHIIAVASGKGGVGKSTVAANLAVALSKTGAKVGILDADIYGPSVPMMFDLVDAKPRAEKRGGRDVIIPMEKYGLKILSIGFFVDQNQALLWRGPMASNALNQLLRDTDWGTLDYLVIDLPPGTGDIHLTIVQEAKVSGVAIVSTPQNVALADARKAFSMFNSEKIKVPILGLIENMSYFTPAELPENKYYIFGKEGGKKLADESKVPFLGEIPLVQSICESGDSGKPLALESDDNPISRAFDVLAQNIARQLNTKKTSPFA